MHWQSILMERQLSWNVTCTDSAIAKESNNWTWLWDNFYGCRDLFERAIAMKYMYTAEETAQLRAKIGSSPLPPLALKSIVSFNLLCC